MRYVRFAHGRMYVVVRIRSTGISRDRNRPRADKAIAQVDCWRSWDEKWFGGLLGVKWLTRGWPVFAEKGIFVFVSS